MIRRFCWSRTQELAAQPVGGAAYPFLACMFKQGFLVICAAVVVFGGGLLIGHFATTKWPGPAKWIGADEPVDSVVLGKLKNELHLTPEQTARLTPVITAACSDLRLLSEERRARKLELLDDISTTIAPELTPDQQRRLDAEEAEWQKPRTGEAQPASIVALF